MAVVPYDEAKHHIGLGETEGSLIGLMLDGSYRKSLQTLPTPETFGSPDDLLNTPSLATWTQDDFSGGSFRYQWGADNAMFSYCTGMLPTLLDKTVRTVPPIVQEYSRNDSSEIILAFAYGSVLFLVRPTVVQKYDQSTDTFTETLIPSAYDTNPCTAAAYDAGAGMLYCSVQGKLVVLTVPGLIVPGRTATVTMAADGSKIVTVTHTAHGLSVGDAIFFTVAKVDPRDPDEVDAHLHDPMTQNTFYWVNEVVDANSYKISTKRDSQPFKWKTTDAATSGVITVYYRPASQEVGYEPTRPEIEWAENLRIKKIDKMGTGHSFVAVVADTNRLITLSLGASRAGAPAWSENTRIPAPWKDYAVYNGTVYILSADDFNNTRVFTFDGANFLPITDFPYNFKGECITIYAGRAYVGGAGRDIAGANSYPELYEITGSSLRLVRTFTPEVRDGGEVTPFSSCTTIRKMGVHEGILHLAFDGYGLFGYDVVTDSLYGSSEFSDLTLTDGQVKWMCTANQSLNLWVESAAPAKRGIYRVASLAETVNPYDGQLVTSDFAPEPARDKRWSVLHVQTRYGGVGIEYSTDGGETYTILAATETEDGHYRLTIADLSDVPSGRRVRFRFTFSMTGADASVYTELVAFSVGFLFLDNGKYVWGFSANGADRPQLLDRTSPEQDVAALAAQLQTWAADRTSLIFKDLDGSIAKVNITRYEDFKPIIGLRLIDRDGTDRGLESQLALTLTEV